MTQTKNTNSATSGTMILKTKADVLNFSNLVNSGNSKLNAVLENDIDMNPGIDVKAFGEQAGGVNICPASLSVRVPYEGIFDGKGHTLFGIFGYCLFDVLGYAGIVKNLTVDGFVSKANAAIANDNYGRIENCVNKATVSPNDGYAVGIAEFNCKGGRIAHCRNVGVLNSHDLVYPPFEAPSQICAYRIDDSKCKSNKLKRYVSTKTNKDDGKLKLWGNNSHIGLFLKTLSTGSCYGGLNVFAMEQIKALLEVYADKGQTQKHINDDGENYLHLLLKCRILKKRIPNLIDIIDFLGKNYNIDFELKDKDGNRPEDLLKTEKGRVRPGFVEVVEHIRFWVDQLKRETDEPIDAFGF